MWGGAAIAVLTISVQSRLKTQIRRLRTFLEIPSREEGETVCRCLEILNKVKARPLWGFRASMLDFEMFGRFWAGDGFGPETILGEK